MPQLDYSIVLPCLNEEKTIGECIDLSFKAAKSRGHSIEVIVADNGSTDKTEVIGLELQKKFTNVKYQKIASF